MKFCEEYDITEQGNFEGKSIPNRIGKNSPPWDIDDPCLKRLREYRKLRTQLHLDDKILLSWNAWTIIALARLGLVLDNSQYTDAAVKAQSFIRKNDG